MLLTWHFSDTNISMHASSVVWTVFISLRPKDNGDTGLLCYGKGKLYTWQFPSCLAVMVVCSSGDGIGFGIGEHTLKDTGMVLLLQHSSATDNFFVLYV